MRAEGQLGTERGETEALLWQGWEQVEAESHQGSKQRWRQGQEIRRGWWNVEGDQMLS